MVFSSLLFVFVFLAINMIGYVISGRYKNQWLLFCSLVFYAWGGPKYLILLVGETFVSWKLAIMIAKRDRSGNQSAKKTCLILEVIILLGLLGIFKYLGFFLSTVDHIVKLPFAIPQIVLPIGISFYTFQLLSYVIDVYRNEVKPQRRFWKLLLYSSLFHQCIAGPIVRYETVQKEINRRNLEFEDIFYGVRRFSIGLFKKAVLANSCASVVRTLIPEGVTALSAQSAGGLWLGMLYYMLQLYLDFSAYSDMAIGMGRMIGFHYLENFNYPYIADSVQDFWRRWHISLSSFFRDYVYIPLGGSRCSELKQIRNMFVVWALTGFWHGASWNFIIWGLYYFVFLLFERYVIKGRMPKVLGHIYTLLVVYFGWIIFYFDNTEALFTVLKGMFHFSAPFVDLETTTAFTANLFLLVVVLIAVTPLGKYIRNKLLEYKGNYGKKFWYRAVNVVDAVTPALMLIISAIALVGDSYNPFLYFRF